jgi:hypothetical protein
MIVMHHSISAFDVPIWITTIFNGPLWVAVFFFFSGYGFEKNYKIKADYLNGYIKKKLVTLYLPFCIAELFSVIQNIITETIKPDFGKIIIYIVGIKLINDTLWYVLELLIIDLILYFVYKYIHNNQIIICAMIYILFLGISVLTDVGTWWYFSTSSLIIGLAWSKYEELIEKYLIQGKLSIWIMGIINALIYFTYNLTSIYYTNSNINHVIGLITLIWCPLFAIFVVLCICKIKSVYTLKLNYFEIYLYHLPIINIVRKIYMSNIYVHLFLVFILAFLISEIMYRINSCVKKGVYGK